MLKMTFVYVLCLCLASATVWGGIQNQEFEIFIENGIAMEGGGLASSTVGFSLDNSQLLDDLTQNQVGLFSSMGSVLGECMTVGLSQALNVGGIQLQDTETDTLQTQALVLEGLQLVEKTDGCGLGMGTLLSDISQDQSIDGSVVESSSKLGSVFGNVIGPAGTTELVYGALSSMSSQMQIVY